jgi:hypothetical protein
VSSGDLADRTDSDQHRSDQHASVEPEEAVELGSAEADPEPAYVTLPYDPRPQQENVRGAIALFLVGLMAATIIASFVLLWVHPDRSKELHDLLALVFGPVVALVGAATGYYFGSHAANRP